MTTKNQDIAQVSISLAQPTFTSDAFGIPLILATDYYKDQLISVTSTDDLDDLGYQSSTGLYKQAAAIFAQESKTGKKVPLVKIGQLYMQQTKSKWNITWDADASDGTFTITTSPGGITASIGYNANELAIKTALDNLSNLATVTVTFNPGATKAGDMEGFNVEFTATDGNVLITAVTESMTGTTAATFTQTQRGVAADSTTAAEYEAIKAVSEDFYCVICDVRSAGALETFNDFGAEAVKLATVIEQENRILFVGDLDPANATSSTTTTAALIKAGNFKNAACFFNTDSSYGLAACIVGACIPDKLYAITPNNYPLALITPTAITSTQIGYLMANNCSWFESIGGFYIMPSSTAGQNKRVCGLTAAGYKMESIVAKHYLAEKFNTALFRLLINNTKLGFNIEDFRVIEACLKTVAQKNGVEENIIVAGSVIITMPDLATYDGDKRQVGWLDGITGSGTENIAISKITASFKLT